MVIVVFKVVDNPLAQENLQGIKVLTIIVPKIVFEINELFEVNLTHLLTNNGRVVVRDNKVNNYLNLLDYRFVNQEQDCVVSIHVLVDKEIVT